MRLRQLLLGLNDGVQIAVHELHGQVKLRVVAVVPRPQVGERDDVGVHSEQPHQAHLLIGRHNNANIRIIKVRRFLNASAAGGLSATRRPEI